MAAQHEPEMTEDGLARAAARVGDRWTLLVVESLLSGAQRFGELAEALPGIAPNILAKRLRQLEQSGLVVSTPYSERPVRLSYQLTQLGSELAGALRLLASWGARADGFDAALRHHACGSPLELRHWCPTCDVVVDDPDEGVTWA
ncbi:MAG TPA: helix-turn-helix domain-containing protein [Acidimicrobiales bacterium]